MPTDFLCCQTFFWPVTWVKTPGIVEAAGSNINNHCGGPSNVSCIHFGLGRIYQCDHGHSHRRFIGDQHKPRDQMLTRASGLTWFAIFNACRRGHFGMLRPKITARARAPPGFSPANIAIAVSRHFYFREAKKSDATQIAPRHRASSSCARSDEK